MTDNDMQAWYDSPEYAATLDGVCDAADKLTMQAYWEDVMGVE